MIAGLRRGLVGLARVGRWMRAWPARRMGLAAVAGGLLVMAAVIGYAGPLLAQEGGVGIGFDDLSRHPTHTTVDRFEVQLTHLDATLTYQVRVASDNAASLGLGSCGTAAQSATVTGATAHDLAFVVYACALGGGTLTAEVRPAGADTAAATVSQALTVLAIPEGSPPGVPGAAAASAATRGATKAGTPGVVPNVRFDTITSTSARARWDTPSNGGRNLTGFGLLFWTGPTHPSYGDGFVVGAGLAQPYLYRLAAQHDLQVPHSRLQRLRQLRLVDPSAPDRGHRAQADADAHPHAHGRPHGQPHGAPRRRPAGPGVVAAHQQPDRHLVHRPLEPPIATPAAGR